MNIFFAVNDNYVKYLLVTLTSVLENNKNEKITFYIITTDITELNKVRISLLKKTYVNFEIIYIKPDLDLFNDLNLNIEYITVETYFRYIIANLVPLIDKCLYLDADLVVNGTLKEFYDIDIRDYYCAGVEDVFINKIGYKQDISFDSSELYINAGVLLMNLEKIRKENMVEKLFLNSQKWKEKIRFQDQDIINITFKNKILAVDSIYNFTGENVRKEKSKRKVAVIIHYTGQKKPWLNDCRNKMKYLWKHYNYLTKAIISGRKEANVNLFLHKVISLF